MTVAFVVGEQKIYTEFYCRHIQFLVASGAFVFSNYFRKPVTVSSSGNSTADHLRKGSKFSGNQGNYGLMLLVVTKRRWVGGVEDVRTIGMKQGHNLLVFTLYSSVAQTIEEE